MKLIVGLGNPGAEYDGTRHNVGFDVVDAVASRWRVDFQSAPVDALVARTYPVGEGEIVLLAKPLTFMNLSGHAVGALLHYYRIATPDLLVVTEDVTLPLGRLRARRARRPRRSCPRVPGNVPATVGRYNGLGPGSAGTRYRPR